MQYYIYILSNNSNTTLYTGVTNDLIKRVSEHRLHLDKNSFSSRYNTEKLVYYEITENIESAIEREKKVKKLSRINKNRLIEKMNPQWNDLWEQITA